MKPIYKKVAEIDDVKTGAAFAHLRGRHGISQVAISTAMDVFPSFVSGLESGTRTWSEMWAERYTKAVDKLSK